ncbi:MAG: hypothetical protein FWF51_09730 [Chitinivibrionia bacterium]|nr:hypothetical protein [Chitinivibrionia bacterium]
MKYDKNTLTRSQEKFMHSVEEANEDFKPFLWNICYSAADAYKAIDLYLKKRTVADD